MLEIEIDLTLSTRAPREIIESNKRTFVLKRRSDAHADDVCFDEFCVVSLFCHLSNTLTNF